MARATARPRKTVEDLRALPEGVRAELIEGGVYVTPAPLRAHQDAVLALAALLRRHALERAGGWVFVAPLDVPLPSGDVVQPDVGWVSPERVAVVRDVLEGPPDLAVEVVSPGTAERDRIVKRRLYAQNGVREYWIVDPECRGVEVLASSEGAFRPAGWFRAGERLVSPLLPGLAIEVDEVFPPPPSR